jgi:hypothetical protein
MPSGPSRLRHRLLPLRRPREDRQAAGNAVTPRRHNRFAAARREVHEPQRRRVVRQARGRREGRGKRVGRGDCWNKTKRSALEDRDFRSVQDAPLDRTDSRRIGPVAAQDGLGRYERHKLLRSQRRLARGVRVRHCRARRARGSSRRSRLPGVTAAAGARRRRKRNGDNENHHTSRYSEDARYRHTSIMLDCRRAQRVQSGRDDVVRSLRLLAIGRSAVFIGSDPQSGSTSCP